MRNKAWSSAAFFVLLAGVYLLIGKMYFAQASLNEKEEVTDALFPNDLGSAEVNISSYPANLQKIYRTSLKRCAKCHSLSRTLNSQFLELDEKEMEQFKKSNPAAIKDPAVLKVGEGIWKRYVKRMRRKPGSMISGREAKKIWEFLVYDSKVRKTGSKLEEWQKYRKRLLKEFKKKNPKRYEELFRERESGKDQ